MTFYMTFINSQVAHVQHWFLLYQCWSVWFTQTCESCMRPTGLQMGLGWEHYFCPIPPSLPLERWVSPGTSFSWPQIEVWEQKPSLTKNFLKLLFTSWQAVHQRKSGIKPDPMGWAIHYPLFGSDMHSYAKGMSLKTWSIGVIKVT